MRRLPSPLRVHAALLLVSLLFGANYVFTKQVLAAVPPGAWVLFRIAAATAVMVPLALALRPRAARRPHARQWAWLAVAALLGVAANQVLFTEGMARTTPEHSAVVNACIPTWTLLVAVLCRQERLTGRRVAAIALALLGVLWLLAHTAAAPADRSAPTLLGDLLTLANGLAFACHLVLMRAVARDLDPWTTTAALFVLGTPLVGVWSAPQVSAAHVDAVLAPPALWFALYGVFGATVLTYLLNTWALRHVTGSQVALYINVQPLVATALHAAMGAPLPGAHFAVALLLVASGLWLQTRRG